MKYINFSWNTINGPLLFTAIHLIKNLQCTEQDNLKTNETKLEKEIDAKTEEDGYNLEVSTLISTLQQKCQCPCKDVPRSAVCGKTTNGQLKTFDSQCHLICHNQCETTERYAIITHYECPILPLLNRKNIYSQIIEENRRVDHAIAHMPIDPPIQWQCDCSYCLETRWIRFDYYSICAERGGQKITFESWCHFDCENKCVKHTGYTYMYLYKGPCEQDMQQEYTEEIVIPRDHSTSISQPCEACSIRCKDFFEPVCVKSNRDEFLSFKSRCHMRCHIQCSHEKSDNYVEVYEGRCPWL